MPDAALWLLAVLLFAVSFAGAVAVETAGIERPVERLLAEMMEASDD